MRVDTLDISKYFKQKYPFCFIDRVVEFEIGKSITGYKNESTASIYFESESGQIPLFALVELMGQLSELLLRMSIDLTEKTGYLAGVQDVKINNKIELFDKLIVKNELITSFSGIYKTSSTIYHNNEVLCKGILIHNFK